MLGGELLEVLIGHLSKDAVRRDTRRNPSAGEGSAIALTWDVSEATSRPELFEGESMASKTQGHSTKA